MKIIDARSGQEMVIGQTIAYPDGESLTLLDYEPGLFSASATIRTVSRDLGLMPPGPFDVAAAPLVTRRTMVPLVVRWFHPRFFGQHVAFVPS